MSATLEKYGTESPSFYNVYFIPCSKVCCLSKTGTQINIYFLCTESVERKGIYISFVLLRFISVLPE